MLELRVRPQSTFAGVVVYVKEYNFTTYLYLSIPYKNYTRRVLHDVHVDVTRTNFCIHLGNVHNFMEEIEEIVRKKTDIPMEYVFFSSYFVNKYVNLREWEVRERKYCYPTDEELMDKKRERWLFERKRIAG